MRKFLTPSGSAFNFEGSLEEGLTIQTSGIRDNTGVTIDIPAETINIIKNLIKEKGKILMGASRTDPSPSSLGETLKNRYEINPNWLSYVIPLLKEDGFCDIVQNGRAFTIIYKGQKRTKQPSENQNNKQEKSWVKQLLHRIDMVEKLTKEDQGIFLSKNLVEEYRAIVKKAIFFSADLELKQLDSHPEPLGILDSQKDWLLNEIRRLRAILEHPI